MPTRDAVEFLLHEHQVAKAKFAEIEQTPAPLRAELWRKLQPELKVHEVVEDTYLYGPLAQDPKAAGTPLAGFEERQDEDVATVEQMMAEADALDPADDAWLAKIMAIREALAKHIAVEESEILPLIPRVWSAEQLLAAGAQMEAAKLRQTGKVAS
jgi:hemerythrin-like domain-containing protein